MTTLGIQDTGQRQQKIFKQLFLKRQKNKTKNTYNIKTTKKAPHKNDLYPVTNKLDLSFQRKKKYLKFLPISKTNTYGRRFLSEGICVEDL
jgi:hypothetical protein